MLWDAIDNIIEVTRNAGHCLFYNRPLGSSGLTWGQLCDWWRATNSLGDSSQRDVARSLYNRLAASVKDNPVEYTLFQTYRDLYKSERGADVPVLLPQVYLRHDPSTWKQRGGRPRVLARERMDFLLLLPNGGRVVIEVDGKQHYAEGDTASPVQEALWRLMQGRTAIVVAHRRSTVVRMDRLIVLDRGRIVEQGTHAELLDVGGTYAKLWRHQSGGFLDEAVGTR